MPRNPRCYIRNTVIEVCFRTIEGLPLVPKPYIRHLLLGIMARAQELYPVKLTDFLFMSNHPHLILVVQDPADIYNFIGYIKRESAIAINKLLGRRNSPVWVESYDAVVILDPEKVVDRLVYIYTNPQKANLIKTIEEYPNLNTWEYLLKGIEEKIKIKRPNRKSINILPENELSSEEEQNIAQYLEENGFEENILKIEPFAWMRCFEELKSVTLEQMQTLIISSVRQVEEQLANHRRNNDFSILGSDALKKQSIREKFTPKKWGKKMICMSSIKNLRVSFISWFKEQREIAREVFKSWEKGIYKTQFPPGFFAPGGYLCSNINNSLLIRSLYYD